MTQEAVRLEAEARSLAALIVASGREPGADEIAVIHGETAPVLIGLAEMRARLISREMLDAELSELADIENDIEAGVLEELRALPDPSFPDIMARLTEAAQHGVARIDRHQEQFKLFLAEHAANAWRQAVVDLMPMAPPARLAGG
jgi:hypothetical protein